MSEEEAPRPPREIPETLNKEGASRLKAKIQAHWESRGFLAPKIELENAGFVNSARCARFDVRSDMVNGLPRVRVSDLGAKA